MKIGYRKDLDGLRGISIIAVLIYHFFPKALPGGFIGVDVFFSLSGFLITSIILNEIEHGNFSLSSFYNRRIKRLFPALLAVLIVSLITGSSVLTLTEWKRLCKHVIGGATFLSNFLTVSESGYFDAKSERNPLLHLWSLAIEEQFYLIWPAVILLAIRFKIHPMIVAILLCMLSFFVNLKLSFKNSTMAFFMPYSRFWEIMLGAVAAIFGIMNLSHKKNNDLDHVGQDLNPNQVQKFSFAANFIPSFGIFLIIFSVFYINRTKVFPGFLAMLPTVGTCLVLYANQPSNVGILLSNPVLRYIGMISYPLYLWHWIVLVFAKNLKTVLTIKDLGIAVLISVLLSVATYEFVEKPVRKSDKKWLSGVLILSLAIVGSLGGYFYLAPVKSAVKAGGVYVTPDEIKTEYERYWKILDYRYFSSPRRVVVFGDSQGYDLFSALMWDTRVGVKIFQSDNFCSGFFDIDSDAPPNSEKVCQDRFKTMLNSNELKLANVLVYTHYWESVLEKRTKYFEAIEIIRKKYPKLRIIFIGPKPLLGKDYLDMNIILKNKKPNEDVNSYLNKFRNIRLNETGYVRALASDLKVGFIDINPIFCPKECPYYVNGKFSYMEHIHWTASGASYFFYLFMNSPFYQSILKD